MNKEIRLCIYDNLKLSKTCTGILMSSKTDSIFDQPGNKLVKLHKFIGKDISLLYVTTIKRYIISRSYQKENEI